MNFLNFYINKLKANTSHLSISFLMHRRMLEQYIFDLSQGEKESRVNFPCLEQYWEVCLVVALVGL